MKPSIDTHDTMASARDAGSRVPGLIATDPPWPQQARMLQQLGWPYPMPATYAEAADLLRELQWEGD